MLNSVHFILQGKGGIGKSFKSVLLAQYFLSKNFPLWAFDTDQENTTFSHYKALAVEHIPVMNESRTINSKMFDALLEKLLSQEGVFVIDNGANTFSPFLAYMVENDVIRLLQENGKKSISIPWSVEATRCKTPRMVLNLSRKVCRKLPLFFG